MHWVGYYLGLTWQKFLMQMCALCCHAVLSRFSCVWLFATLWTVACPAPLSMGFSRQEYCSGLQCLLPGDLPNPGMEPTCPACQADPLPAETPGKPKNTGVGSLVLLQGISQPRNRCLILSNCFSASIEMTLLCFIFSSLVSWITLIDFQMFNQCWTHRGTKINRLCCVILCTY